MTIRPAQAQDAAAMAAIWNPIIRDSAITFTTEEKTPEAIAAMLAAPEGVWLVAEEGGALLGFAGYGPFRGGPGYAASREVTVHLAADARGRGLGRALMQALEAEARAAHIHVLIAGISGENPGAVAFHAALGFEEVGRMPEVGQKFGRWMTLLLMQKIL